MPARGSKNEGKRQRQRQLFASSRSYFPRSLALSLSRVLAAVRRWSLNCNCFDFVFCFFPVLFASFLFIGGKLFFPFFSLAIIYGHICKQNHTGRGRIHYSFSISAYTWLLRGRGRPTQKKQHFWHFLSPY